MRITLHGGDHVKNAIIARLSEWMLAVSLAMMGVVLTLPGHSLYSFAFIRTYIPDVQLGQLFIAGGVIRVTVLACNGLWAPPMYLARAWMALSSSLVWMLLTIGSSSSGLVGVWLATFPVFAVFDAINYFRALADAADAKLRNDAARRVAATAARSSA